MKNKVLLFLITIAVFTSCSKMNDTHEEFLKDGDLYYVGAPYNVMVTSGTGSVDVSFNKTADPSVEKYVIYWNNRNNQKDVIPTASAAVERVIISGLARGNYNFELIAFDKAGHKSNVVYAVGVVN